MILHLRAAGGEMLLRAAGGVSWSSPHHLQKKLNLAFSRARDTTHGYLTSSLINTPAARSTGQEWWKGMVTYRYRTVAHVHAIGTLVSLHSQNAETTEIIAKKNYNSSVFIRISKQTKIN